MKAKTEKIKAQKIPTTVDRIRVVDSRAREVIVSLYFTCLRPYVEYCVHFWGPQHIEKISGLWDQSRGCSEGWNTSPMKTG